MNLANGEAKFIKPQPEAGSTERYRFDWNSPILISPHNNRRIYLDGNRMFIWNDRGNNWTTITPDLTKAINGDKLPILGVEVKPNVLSGHDGQENYSHIVTIAESPVKEGVLWVGADDGNVQVSRDGGKSWKSLAATLPERGSVYSIAEDHADRNLLFCGTEFGVFFTPDRRAEEPVMDDRPGEVPSRPEKRESAYKPPPSVRLPTVIGGLAFTAGFWGVGVGTAYSLPDAPGVKYLNRPVIGPWQAIYHKSCKGSCAWTDYVATVWYIFDGLAQAGGIGVALEGLFLPTASSRG